MDWLGQDPQMGWSLVARYTASFASLCLVAACSADDADNMDAGNAPSSAAAASGGAAKGGSNANTGGAGHAGSAGSMSSTGGSTSAGSSGNAGSSASGGGGNAGTSGTSGNTDAAVPDASGGDSGSGDAGSGNPGTATPLAERVCPKGASFGNPLPGGTPSAQPVQAGFGFLEGPVWLADKGWLLFSDMDMGGSNTNGPLARIRRLVPPNTFDVFVEQGNSNGLALDVDGAVIACTHDAQTLSRYLPDTGMRITRALTYMGKHFNSPNDLTVRSDGMVFFTDPDWQLGPRTNETMITGVYSATPTNAVALVDGTLSKPNGITLSPDEQTLYVGSSGPDIRAYPLNPDGTVGTSTMFASPGGSDGMTVDCAGNLYVAGGNTVKVYPSTGGDPLGTIAVAGTTSNVAFGGPDKKTLYITAGNTLYSITLQVPGLPY